MSQGDRYSPKADEQLDQLEGDPAAPWDKILEAIDEVFDRTSSARMHSTSIRTREGIRMRLPVMGTDYYVVWDASGPRIEAVTPYPLY